MNPIDPRVIELHGIMPIAHLASVIEHGILSRARAERLRRPPAMLKVDPDGRDAQSVPRGRRLNEYARLYFHAGNPTLFERQGEAAGLCVLRVSTEVLELPGTVITDGDASSDYVRCLSPSQSEVLDFDDIYSVDWWHPGDLARGFQHRYRKCAEVLVPDRVEPRFLNGAYVVDSDAAGLVTGWGAGLPIEVAPSLFGGE